METDGGSRKALVIGISDYDLLPQLEFCRTDGTKVFDLLRTLGYEIPDKYKLIGRVKREDMRAAIIDFFRDKNVRPRDTLLFYFSGHGVLDGYGDHYFAASSLDPSEPDKEGFFLDDITKMIKKSNSQKIVSILDCCFSGAATLGITERPEFTRNATKLSNNS
jgi:hypothetical protein